MWPPGRTFVLLGCGWVSAPGPKYISNKCDASNRQFSGWDRLKPENALTWHTLVYKVLIRTYKKKNSLH